MDFDQNMHRLSSIIQWNKEPPGEKDLNCPEIYNIKEDEIYPFLLDMDPATIKKGVKPSQMLAAFKLTTEECLRKLRSPLRKYKIGTKKDAFRRVPEAIIFLNYEAGYNSTTLTITNQCEAISLHFVTSHSETQSETGNINTITEVAQNLHIYYEPSRFFTLNMDTAMGSLTKIAPGMAVVLHIAFVPTDSYRDYAHKIEFSSGDTSFIVPIFALGPRPYADMPDKLILPQTLVKVESSDIVVLKNNGKSMLNFSNVIPEPFSSNILKAVIPPEGILEVKFSCYSQKSGTIVGQALSYIRHQFCIKIELECEVKIINVDLDNRFITFDDIYMGLYARKVLTLKNASPYPLNFAWKSVDMDQEQNKITKLTKLMCEMKEYEQQRYEKLKYMDIVDEKSHQDIYERIFHEEKSHLEHKSAFLFSSDFFEIIPKIGKVLPNSDFEFLIIFSPKQNIHYFSDAYLDIEGTERRIRVSFQGSGIGPPVALTVKSVDAGQIFLTDKHQYELTAINKGVVSATITYKPKKTDWGGVLNCIPETLVLGPNCSKAFIVVFYSEHQGEFLETLHFEVEESGDWLQFIFKGKVICPSLKCVPEDLDFGTISVGILSSKELILTNDSRVPINYDFYFEDDFKDKGKKYFNIIPSNGKVLAESSNNIKICFSCDVTAEWKTNLLLVMWKNRMYTKKIPFSCICDCPEIICHPKVVSIKFCFLNCNYYRTVQFINLTDLPGCIEYLPDTTRIDNSIECTLSQTKIDFKAHQTIEVEIKLQVRSLGPHQLPLKFLIIGGSPQLLCTINCNGQGPVVSYHPVEIDFGTIDLLKKYTEKLTLVNDSPTIAKIRVYCKGTALFFIEDDKSSNLELLPEEKTQINICALFNKPGKNKGSIYLEIFQGDQSIIKVSGVGVGTSILCEPPLSPVLNLGKMLTHKNFTQEIRITNKGDMVHKLLFTKRAIVRNLKEIDEDKAPSVFDIVPHYLELDPNQTTNIVVKFSNKKTKSVKEDYYCHALIGKSVQIHTIFTFIVEANFVDPHLDISNYNVNFNLNVVDNKADGNLEETITCENITGIPLQVGFFLDDKNQNFHFFDKNGKKTSKIGKDMNRSSTTIQVHFAPNLGTKRRFSQRARLVVDFGDHPKIDIINLHGEVMFPTLKLYPNQINFQCVPLGSTSSRNIVIQNTSDMDVYFKWFWIEDSIRIKYITPTNVDIVKNIKIADDTIYTTDFMEYIGTIGSYRTELQTSKTSMDNERWQNEMEKYIYDAEKYLNEMKKVLFNVLSPYETPNSDDDFNNFPLKRIPNNRIQKLFSLEPSAGVLKPYGYTTVTIGFTPPPNTEVSATAVCQVKGGEEEVLYVIGKSSKLCFKLDRNCVSYGTQVFCELCSGQLTLTNTGISSFDYKVVLEETQYMQAEMLDVQPKGGKINAEESVTFKIDYFPGFPGNFSKSFLLELGYLEPVVINVEGYAVPSQVYLHLPRPDMKQEIEDSYKAISWITPQYLELVKSDELPEIYDKPWDPTNFLKNNNWVYVSYNDLYPSLMDIDLAMERIVAFNLICQNPKILKDHTFSKNVPHIPQFAAPEYLVDFGYVVRDIPVCYTIMIYNYGPIETDIKLIEDNKTALLEKEIKLEYNSKALSVGEMTDLYVIFAPTKRKFLELNKPIEECFRLTVKHGPIITVLIKAVVTEPNVSLEHEKLYFEKVYCGDALRKTVVLSNNGYIKSRWQASIKKPSKKEDMARFIVLPKTGILEPGDKTYLNIYFIPVDTKLIQRSLRIETDGSPVLMELIGQGLEPNLKVITSELKFTPTLSYFKNIMTFTVQNVSDIPIEFYFPTLDDVSQREKSLTEIYLKYKNLKCVFAPLRYVGNGLPHCFQTTHDCLVNNLRKRICQNSENVEAGDREIRKSHIEVGDPLVKFSNNELNSMLLEYIAADGFLSDCGKASTIYEMDDSTDRFEILEQSNKTTQEEIERKAVLFIFHGAPTTDYYKAANQVGIALSIPVYSIDRLIIESLVEENDPAAIEISEIINESFEKTIVTDLDKDLTNSIKEETNEYDKIFAKILKIIAPKTEKSPKKKSRHEKESATPSEKSSRRSRKAGDCFLDIASEALVDLLKAKMKSFSYLVIESLNSTFIPKQNQALYILLKAAGCISYISLVVLSYTVDNYVKNWESAQENIETGGNSERGKDQMKRASKTRSVLPAEASASGKAGKASTKVGSEKLSKASNAQRDRTKKILQTLNKNLKADLEEFESLRAELIHVSQYWDKQNAILKKPFNLGLQKRDNSTKDSARTNRNSSFKKSISAIALGDTCEAVLNSTNNRLVDYPKLIRNFVENNVELQRIVNEIEENEKDTFLESETFFTVITNPTCSKNEFSTVFRIRNFKVADVVYPVRTRSKSGSSIGKVKRRRTSKSSRRRSSETKSNQETKSFVKPENDAEFSPRTILFPGDLVKYQVTFCPRKCGIYKYIFTLETVKNGSKGNYQIKCKAICEFPKINFTPEVVFPKTLDNYREKASYDHFVYIKDQRIFDFGSIIAGSSPDKCLLYSTTISLRNDSSSNCEITVTLSNDVFTIEPTNFIIAPESESLLTISAKSTIIGTQVAQMYILIRNNPLVESITLACSPCKLEFSVQPRTIAFDKVPVSYSAKRVVRLTNTSPINLRWEFVDPVWANDIFELSHERGTIDLYSTCEIVVRFSPTEEISIPKRVLLIKVFDVNSVSNDPCCLESLTIHADSVQYNLDLESHIDYGEIKGGVNSKRLFPITNKGKCDVILKCEIVNNPLESNNFVREYLKVQPLLLTLGSQKTENLSIGLYSKCDFSVQNLLIFVVSMVESIQTGHIVKSYKVTMSATCFMPKYTICPLSRVNFGYVPLRNVKKQIIQLANRGKFSFNFNLINCAKIAKKATETGKGKKAFKDKAENEKINTKNEKKANSEKTTKNKSATSKATSKTDKKKQNIISKLEVGSFNICPSSGVVEPNETFTIEVEIKPDEVKPYEEKILINIQEIENMQNQKVVSLHAVGCEPKINLRDFENVFAEQHIVKKIEDFILPRNVAGCCIFSSSETSLYFKLVCIGTSFSTKLYFANIGYATSQLTAKIDESSKQVFAVTPLSQTIEPHSKHFVEVTFSPRSVDPMTGNLEITYNATADNKLIIPLYGRASLPQIQLLKPFTDSNEAYLEFEPICVGYRMEKRVSFRNISEIKCKVILELSPSDDVFSIVPVGSTLQMLNVQEALRYMVNLLVDDIAEFDVICEPKERAKNQVTLILHTVHNPYEVNKVSITADSYDDDIVLEGLELEVTVLNPSQGSQGSQYFQGSQGSQESQYSLPLPRRIPTEYHLNLGYKELNKIYKTSVKIRNRSKNHTYKFILESSAVLFVPEIGHLKPLALKEITVIFKSLTPVLLEKEEICCIITKIEYVYPDEDPTSWDDRLRFAFMSSTCDITSYFGKCISVPSLSSKESLSIEISSSSRFDDSTVSLEEEETEDSECSKTTTLEDNEPETTTLPDSLEMIPLILTVSADYCRYKCETKAIEFADTYINEEDIKNVVVENIGSVPIAISWTIDNNDCMSSTSKTCILESSVVREEVSTRSGSPCGLFSNVSIESEPSVPIVIKPKKIVVEPGSTGFINLHFLPKTEDNFEGILQSNVDTLDPTLDNINIKLNAKSLPIPFYFEMEDKTISSTAATLEFDNIGLATESARKLFLVNPNDDSISFEIIPKDIRDFSQFVCGIPRGPITGKTKNFTIFYFQPPMLGLFKEEYLVKIPEKNVQKTILLLGLCREPKVYFSQKTIELRATVPNVKSNATIKLCNDENFPILFRFLKKTLYSENQLEKLEIYPSAGKLQPGSEQNIKCTFTTANIVSASFYIKCVIEKRESPLSLVVSASSVRLIPLVKYTNKNGEIVILKEDAVNVMDLGSTYKGRKDIVKFEIANTNEIGISYTWKFDTSYVDHIFNIFTDKQKEFIESNEVSMVNLSFDAVGKGILKQFKILLHIMYGPEYIIHVNAVSDKPSFSFSFNSYNFGYCLKQSKETNYYSTVLIFKNLDAKKILVENLFQKTDFLTVDFTSCYVPPGEIRQIPIHFFPQTVGSYKTKIVFLLDGIKNMIPISGEAVNVNLELCNLKDRFINFGEIRLGNVKKYHVGVFNNSPAKVDFHFNFYENLFVHQRKIEKLDQGGMKIPAVSLPEEDKPKNIVGKKYKLQDTRIKEEKSIGDKKGERGKLKKEELKQTEFQIEDSENLEKENLKKMQEARFEFLKCFVIEPNNFKNVPPKGKLYFNIIFQPNIKINFEEKIYLEIQDYIKPFFVIKGSSLIAEFSLEKKEVSFIGIISGCSSSQLINVKNTGDIAGSFKWQIDDKRNLFALEPKQGFVLPKNEKQIKITFSPTHEKCEFRVKAKCIIKEFEETLTLTIKGNSVKMPKPTSIVTMKCNVREQVVESVMVNNNTSDTWLLQCDLSNDAFFAPKEIVAVPFNLTPITITYRPKKMTTVKPDEADLFVKIPDGSGLLYKLIGNAEPPLLKKRIEKEIRCKKNFHQAIPIENWLSVKQTFEVITEVVSPISTKTLYRILGLKNVELKGKETKNYNWGAYVVNEGLIEFRVTFKTSEGEYMFFEISLKVLPSEPKETIVFNTRAREPITKQITLENPVDAPVTYLLESNRKNLIFPKLVKLEAYTMAKIDVTYSPINVETASTIITAKCDELGTYTYLVEIEAIAPKMEECVIFVAEFGAKAKQDIVFENSFERTVDFSYQFDDQHFFMEKCGAVTSGDTARIIIAFEPTSLGHYETKLTLSSSIAGEFIYPLRGKSIPPKPKGPFIIKLNNPATIEFKNPFSEDKQFRLNLSPNTFRCDYKEEEIVLSKKLVRFVIYVNPETEWDSSTFLPGKLIVYSADHPEVQWKYYLELQSQ